MTRAAWLRKHYRLGAESTPTKPVCILCDGPGWLNGNGVCIKCERRSTRDHDDTINSVLADSDAVCEQCGADPRHAPIDVVRSLWFIDLRQTPDCLMAEVLCPTCYSGPAVREEQTNLGPQTLVAGTPARSFPKTPLRAPRRQADLGDTPLFGQERAELERAQEELPL